MADKSSNNSEIVIMDERTVAAAATPTVGKVNVSKFSQLHIGPKFVSVTNSIHNREVISGQILGLELEATKKSTNLRCGIAVFVCWALIVGSGLAIYFFKHVIGSPHEERMDIGLDDWWYLRREKWQAMKEYNIEFLQLPVSNVIIGHSAERSCTGKFSCVEEVLNIQRDHLGRFFDDIGPNFLVGGEGFIFEGRGANVLGSMVRSWNSKSISIMFLGNYIHDHPNELQFENVDKLINTLMRRGVLTQDYVLYGYCQLKTYFVSPGPNIMQYLRNFTHWDSLNNHTCLKS